MLKPPLITMSFLRSSRRQEAVVVEAADVAGADEALAGGLHHSASRVFAGWPW
jgi:hypothetical protein